MHDGQAGRGRSARPSMGFDDELPLLARLTDHSSPHGPALYDAGPSPCARPVHRDDRCRPRPLGRRTCVGVMQNASALYAGFCRSFSLTVRRTRTPVPAAVGRAMANPAATVLGPPVVRRRRGHVHRLAGVGAPPAEGEGPRPGAGVDRGNAQLHAARRPDDGRTPGRVNRRERWISFWDPTDGRNDGPPGNRYDMVQSGPRGAGRRRSGPNGWA